MMVMTPVKVIHRASARSLAPYAFNLLSEPVAKAIIEDHVSWRRAVRATRCAAQGGHVAFRHR
jgi:hypothetical protein